jgi:two-component system cell cycle sensor histidine kinase/response regulator CckA
MKTTRKASGATTPKPAAAAALRQRAEEQLRLQKDSAPSDPAGTGQQRLIHELQVHQIELEMQNEELVHARDERESALQKYADLYDFAPVSYVTLDQAGTVLEANLAAGRLFGLERSRLVRRHLGLLVAPAGRPALTSFLDRVFAGQNGEPCEVTVLRDGRPAAEVRIEAVADVTGEQCRAVLEDITGQKQAEADRLVLSKLESTGVLADGLSHDFNNLLTVILLNIELAQALGPTTGKQADLLSAAKRTALMAGELSRELNRFARTGTSVRKPVDLARVIKDSVPPFPDGSAAKCDLSVPKELWRTEVDEAQIREVIWNVVQNAREAMPPEGMVAIRAENAVVGPRQNSPLPSGDYVHISIADQGAGMTKALREKIFDPYFSTKTRGLRKGMGLGLAISHTMIRGHGGAMTVESTEGAGATFHIHLPASRPVPAGAPLDE